MVAAFSNLLAWSWVLVVPWHVCCHSLGDNLGCGWCDWFWCLFLRLMVLWCLATVQARQSIAYQKLFPVVIAAHLWGS